MKLTQWRQYWKARRPDPWLFPGHKNQRMCITTAQRLYTRSKRAAGIDKRGGIHSLRHAFATHALESGMPIHLDLKSITTH